MMIKICGLTRRDDAEHAVRCGATAIGFVFWPRSPRYVLPAVAADIVSALPRGVIAVGVFVDESIDEMRRVASLVGLGAVQLHGHEPASYADAFDLQVMKAMGVDEAATGGPWPLDALILLDAVDPVARGGTGTRVDWAAAAAVARRRRVVLAGGLTPDNVAEAIASVAPFGVDVSSGVERMPGIKDGDKVKRFIEQAGSAFERLGEVERDQVTPVDGRGVQGGRE